MEKEFGKWLMDIAKYITTAVIISSVFSEADSISMYVVASLAVVVTLYIGLTLIKRDAASVKQRNKNKIKRK